MPPTPSATRHFSGNAAISYVFDSGFVPYLSYAESFQPPAGADASATGSLKPTEGKQWELGVKYQPPGSKTLLTAAVYDLTQKNVAVNYHRQQRQSPARPVK
jgi:iron complex outermembrane receptor protein